MSEGTKATWAETAENSLLALASSGVNYSVGLSVGAMMFSEGSVGVFLHAAFLGGAACVACRVLGGTARRVRGGRQRCVRDALRPLRRSPRDEASAFVSERRGSVAAAVRSGDGLWLVRDAGADAFRAMTEEGFAEYARKVAAAGGFLRSAAVEGSAAVLSRFKDGLLEGEYADEPAVVRLTPDGGRQVGLYSRGIGTRRHAETPPAAGNAGLFPAGFPSPER